MPARRRSPRPYLAVLLASALLASAVAACGGGDSDPPAPDAVPEEAVAVVGETAIPEAAFERRLTSKLRQVDPIGGGITSSSLTIDPPRFSKCVAELRRNLTDSLADAQQPETSAAPTRSQLLEGCEQQYEQTRMATVSELIEDQWVIQSAADDGFELTDEQVRDRLEQYSTSLTGGPARSRKQFESLLRRSGLNQADLQTRLRATLARQKALQDQTTESETPSEDELSEFYEDNPQLFGRPGERTVEVVAVGEESAAEDALSRIENGASVPEVSVELSDDVAVLGGDGFLTVQQGPGPQPSELVEEIFAAPEEDLVGPIEVEGNWYVFRVISTQEAQVPPFSEVQEQVLDLAKSQQVQRAQIDARSRLEDEWRPRTLCAEDFIVAQCSNGPDLPDLPPPS